MDSNDKILSQLQPFRLPTDEDDEIAGIPIDQLYELNGITPLSIKEIVKNAKAA